MSRMKRWLIGIGIGSLLSNNIILYVTFLQAYFNDYRTTVFINIYNEAHLEFIMLPVCLGISVIVVCELLKPFHSIRVRRRDRL